MFNNGNSNPTTIKHIYNESENLNESCDIAFDVESSINSASDWRGEYGDTRWPSLFGPQ